MFDGLGESALAHRDVAKTTARDCGEDIDDALKLLARVHQAIEAQVDVAEIDGGGVIAWLQPARRSERLGRFLEPAGLLIQDAEQMRPLAVSRCESPRVHIRGFGGVEELVGVIQRGRAIRRRPRAPSTSAPFATIPTVRCCASRI